MLRQEGKKMRNNIIVSDHIMNTPRMVWRDKKNVYFT